MSENVDKLRAAQTRLRILQNEMTILNDHLKDHPAKPQPGEATLELVAEWQRAKAPFVTRRTQIHAEIKALNAQAKDVRGALNQSPMSKVSLGVVLDRLANLEATFATQGHAAAWDQLSGLIDYLEYEDARISVEEQVAKLEQPA